MALRACNRSGLTAKTSGRPRRGLLGLLPMAGLAVSTSAGPALPAKADVAEAPTPVAHSASLSHTRVLPYPFALVWPTAIRYLRVDRGFALQDRDEQAGYVLFQFELSGERTGQGSLEAFSAQDPSGRDGVQVKVSTSQGPAHLPHAIVEGLAEKLRAERGPPPPPPAPEPPGTGEPGEQDDPG